MNSVNNKKFDHSQYETYFFYLGSFVKILIKYLQLYLLCSSNNQFENYSGRALGLNGSVWNSSFLYL